MKLVMLAYTRTRPSLGTFCDQPGQACGQPAQARVVGHAVRRPGGMAFEALPFDALASEVLAQGATLPGGTGQSAGTTTGNTTVLRAAVRSLRPLALWGPVPDPLLA